LALPLHYLRVGCPLLLPLICITKIPGKKEGGRERGEALPDFQTGDCR